MIQLEVVVDSLKEFDEMSIFVIWIVSGLESIKESVQKKVLAWRISCAFNLRPGWWRSWPSAFSTKHLFPGDPTWFLISLVEPGGDDLVSEV